MGLTTDMLKESDTGFHGIIPTRPAYPLGKISLDVVFGTPSNFRKEKLEFEVVDWESQYHAILGRPAFAKFMAIPHYAYLKLKMPGNNGTEITVHGSFSRSDSYDRDFQKIASKFDVKEELNALDAVTDHTKLPADNRNESALIEFLRERWEIFAWEPSYMPGIPRELAENTLNVDPKAKPVQQTMRRFSEPKIKAIGEEVNRLRKAGFIQELKDSEWVANPVMVPKKDTTALRMCIDYTSLNKHCPKDHFPLPRIDQIVDSTAGCDRLSFLDAYSGYNQIKLKKEDQELTAFITPPVVFCYNVMTFGLKNAGATYQRCMQACLGEQMGRNIEVYIDDIVVKTKHAATLIDDLRETFDNLDRYKIKLNPKKCFFGVRGGQVFGYFISARGIEANPLKIKAILDMEPPKNLHQVQQLAGRLAALSRFIAKLGEKALPFYQLMKKSEKFEWTEEAQESFDNLKRILSTSPVLLFPNPLFTPLVCAFVFSLPTSHSQTDHPKLLHPLRNGGGALGKVFDHVDDCGDAVFSGLGNLPSNVTDDADDAADQTIRESLELLNQDFAAYSSDSVPRFLDIPVFDRTPAVEKGNMGSPVFDYTPLRQVLESETVEATPVMEETQSQSVVGTQVVTQDYMVEDQLAKEKERQAAKLAQHQEKLTTYYRKYPAKAKSAKGNAVVDDVPRDGEGAESTRDECAAETIPPKVRKERGVCRKYKENSPLAKAAAAAAQARNPVQQTYSPATTQDDVAADKGTNPVRRSPRVAATVQSTVASKRVSSPGKSRLGHRKRKIDVDETYVPDSTEDGVAAGKCNAKKSRTEVVSDESDFEAPAKVKKVGRKPGPSKPVVSEGDSKKVLKRPTKKTMARKRKAVEDLDGEKTRFQQTIRCSLGEVRSAAAMLKENHRLKVEKAGFGCVFQWVLEGNISRVLMCYLMKTIDTSTMKVACGSGRVLEVNRDSVHQVFGFPIGGDTPILPAESGHDESLALLKQEFGFESNASIEPKDLRQLLSDLVEDPEKEDLAVKVFFAILFSKLICPGSATRVGREAAMLVNMDYDKMAKMDYCQLVVDELKRAATKYQDPDIPQAGLEGCAVIPTVMYLDSILLPPHSVMHTRTPRANFLHEKPLKAIYKMDIERNGGPELMKYKFGRIVWKGRNQIAYSYRYRVEDLIVDLNEGTHRSEPDVGIANEHPAGGHCEMPFSQLADVNTKDKHQSASTSDGKPSAGVIDEIGSLLHKVEYLSRTIPTTADRVKQFQGRLADGTFPSFEALDEQAKRETSFLDSLRGALSLMRTGFLDFGMNQDSLCKQYESRVNVSGNNNVESNVLKNIHASGEDVDAGLGQSAAEAEEDARIAEENASQNSGDGDDARMNDDFVRPPTPQCPPPFSGDHVGDVVFDKSPPVAEVNDKCVEKGGLPDDSDDNSSVDRYYVKHNFVRPATPVTPPLDDSDGNSGGACDKDADHYSEEDVVGKGNLFPEKVVYSAGDKDAEHHAEEGAIPEDLVTCQDGKDAKDAAQLPGIGAVVSETCAEVADDVGVLPAATVCKSDFAHDRDEVVIAAARVELPDTEANIERSTGADDDDKNQFQAGDSYGCDASDSIEQSSSIFEESTDDLSASIEESPHELGKDI
ncbi:hypothetical protein QYE76_044134 [Lolium multiflorum]|uniref:Reverse transcriptase domain-containing protein n=1 Tax=Lolium multiflorum TaxID=4521 RepID=A0AAD8TIP3_LOLMU|nr:hypothetical protein QYE76_044134 [Lolium multiflorum]